MSRSSAHPLAALALVLGACVPEEGPMMMPGADCLECHGGGGGGGGARAENGEGGGEGDGPPWTVAGTVFHALDAPTSAGVLGAHVRMIDATGRAVTLRTNAAGNFYLADPLAFPLQVSIEHGGVVRTMTSPVTYGGCNGCHTWPGGDAGGRLAIP
jgi:hypothetical protein